MSTNREHWKIWRTKLAAWLHDPGEKALILMRAIGGHEAGTVAKMNRLCFGAEKIEEETAMILKLADHWASAADRPSLPKPKTDPHAGDEVRFWGLEGAEIIHPLSGDRFSMADLYVAKAGDIENSAFKGLFGLLPERTEGHLEGEEIRTAFLRLWRMGPETAPEKLGLGSLWGLLPADTRVPDHSIWEHLSLTSAFAGAMAGDPEKNPALLQVSIGPVQGFIAQARSVSDLWAGSHFLARLSWEGMKLVCEDYGPDAVVFPNLHGVPVVDQWLRGLGVEIKERHEEEWRTDANPIFSAALPNRFVALVPASAAAGLAGRIEKHLREFALATAGKAARELLGTDGISEVMEAQINAQMEDFPEVAWAVVPWKPLVQWSTTKGKRPRTKIENTEKLAEFIQTMKSEESDNYLKSDHWSLLKKAIDFSGAGPDAEDPFFYHPNPGVLYPALYEALDALTGAAKAARPFRRKDQNGYRCSLCGEREWLTDDRDLLEKPPGSREGTVWDQAQIGGRSEYLCAWCTLKRGWPSLFTRETSKYLDLQDELRRYVVSTHTMALARDLEALIDQGDPRDGEVAERSDAFGRILRLIREHQCPGTALPRKLALKAWETTAIGKRELYEVVRKLPSLLDEARETADREGGGVSLLDAVAGDLKKLLGNKHKPEAYYGLILFDGDRMGAWVSGTDDDLKIRYEDAWHHKSLTEIRGMFPPDSTARKYMDSKRAPSPARHMAISRALNNFSLDAARWVVEDLFLGKLIYSGGDDVLAMVSVDDILPCMLVLRCVYSGQVPAGDQEAIWELFGDLKKSLKWIANGHLLLHEGKRRRLLRMMGSKATASAGAVIAHHMTPLQSVLRELRAAEHRAKNEGGRNAFSLSLMKRSGGTTTLTAPWGFGGETSGASVGFRSTIMGVLFRLSTVLATEGVSRRAAYNILQWLPDFPESPGHMESSSKSANRNPKTPADSDERPYREMLATNIGYQLHRQGIRSEVAEGLASQLTDVAIRACRPENGGNWTSVTDMVREMLIVAEFLAREGRTLGERTVNAEPDRHGKEA